MSAKKTILIVDDHPLVREGLKTVISANPAYEVVGEAASGGEALRMVNELKPNLVLLDLALPDQSGILVCRQIRDRRPNTKILILSMHSKTDFLVKAFQAGANGYLAKESSTNKLFQGLKSVSDGEYFIDGAVSHKLVERLMNTPQDKPKIKNSTYEALTPREQEILILLVEGMTNQQIADRLFISIKTVKNHRANIMQKLDIHSVHELIRFAAKLGLIDLELWKD